MIVKKEEKKVQCQVMPPQDIVISLDLAQIENMYTIEENAYIARMNFIFDHKWKSLSFGEEKMSLFISFCSQRFYLPPRFMYLLESTKKYISFYDILMN